MVSKASEDLPEPERPVNTTSLSRGIDSVTFFRLCSRAPRIVIWSMGKSYLFLSSRNGKRRGRGGDQLSVRPFDPALGHHRPAPRVDHGPLRAQHLANLRGGDEVELQIEAHGSNDARLDGSQRPPHGRIGHGADHPTLYKTRVICHVFRGLHLAGGVPLAGL